MNLALDRLLSSTAPAATPLIRLVVGEPSEHQRSIGGESEVSELVEGAAGNAGNDSSEGFVLVEATPSSLRLSAYDSVGRNHDEHVVDDDD